MKSICLAVCIAILSLLLSCEPNNAKSPEGSADQVLKPMPTDLLKEKSTESSGLAELTGTNDNTTLKTINANTLLNFNATATNDEIADNPDRYQGEGDQENDKKQPPQQQKLQQQPVTKVDWDKKIIKTAQLNAEVKDLMSFYTTLREKVKGLGGYIAQEEQVQSEYRIENSVVIKVPVDQFDNAVTALTTGTEKINDKRINAQDVTAEVVDIKSRLEAKKQARLRYLELMKQAKNVEEMLNVQSEINGIQEEIESAAGRVQYLSHSATYSTINFTYYQVLALSAKETGKPSFFAKLGTSLSIGWNVVGDVVVAMASLWPLILLVAVIIVVYRRTRPGVAVITNKK